MVVGERETGAVAGPGQPTRPSVWSVTGAKSSRARGRYAERVPSHVVGIDDGPFERGTRGKVLVVGTVYAGLRLDGVISTTVRRDGDEATRAIAEMVRGSRFAPQVQLVMLQGITVAGFNVIDVAALHAELAVPVLVVARRAPDLTAIGAALRARVRGGGAKWARIQAAGPMEPVGSVWIQRVGISLAASARLIEDLAAHGHLPEPLRVAHLVAGALVRGQSRGSA
ncbi:MAG: DUF99 family protein [Deltaproteobacteria bacterium]|nr:DUF99 family protein [Deltaproteobacteria bacterium]